MRKIRKMLSEESIGIRHRRSMINIHITVMHWLTEFLAFLVIVLGSFVFGHGNAIVTLCLQTTSNFFLFNLLPCILLINHSDVKGRIAESEYYIRILKMLKLDKDVAGKCQDGGDEESQNGDDNNEDT